MEEEEILANPAETETQPTLTLEHVGKYDKNDLMRQVAHNVGMNSEVVEAVTEEVIRVMRAATTKHGRIEIFGLGSFSKKKLAPKSGVDPHGNPYSVGERGQIEFNAAEKFCKELEAADGINYIS